MASLTFTVDTAPMAHSVDTARGHLNGVTAAVTAMEAAVIATERHSAKTICENVDNGFYVLVKSQISQKAVAAYTEMTSKQMILLQLVKALDNVKRQMDADYAMISRRYAKLFQSINKALETRIRELDRPAMQLAEIRRNIVFDKLKDSSSMLLSISGETLPVAQTALSGKLKQKTRDTMQTLSSSIEENDSYSKKVDSIMMKTIAGGQDGDTCYLPALVCVTASLLNNSDYIENVYVPQNEVWQNTAPVAAEISRFQQELAWSPQDAAQDGGKALIRKEVLALCEKDQADERIKNEIIRLFDESAWEEPR
jgi:hypothetical protein